MSGFTVIVLFIFGLMIGARADRLGRNFLIWMICAMIFTPLLTWIALEISGKTDEKKEEENNLIPKHEPIVEQPTSENDNEKPSSEEQDSVNSIYADETNYQEDKTLNEEIEIVKRTINRSITKQQALMVLQFAEEHSLPNILDKESEELKTQLVSGQVKLYRIEDLFKKHKINNASTEKLRDYLLMALQSHRVDEISNIGLSQEPEQKPQTNISPEPVVQEPVHEIKTWKFERSLTHAQKIIFSLSVFAVLLVISYAFAESIDYKMRMKKTWLIWVGFILSQAWLQNKFWNSGLSFEFKVRKPNTSKLKLFWASHKRKFYIGIAVIFILSIIGLSIDPIKKYLHDKEIKQLAQPNTLPEKLNKRFINRATAITKYEYGSISINLLVEMKGDKTINVSKLKTLYQYIESKNAEQVFENPVEETVVYYTQEQVWNPYKNYNTYIRDYTGGFETQRTPHYKKQLKMTYINKPLIHLDDREDFIREYAEESSFKKLFDSLRSVSYYSDNYASFFSTYAANTPDRLEVNLTDVGGFAIVGCYFQKSSFTPLVSDRGELVSYSYSGKFCEGAAFTEDDYKKIKDWNIEWKD